MRFLAKLLFAAVIICAPLIFGSKPAEAVGNPFCYEETQGTIVEKDCNEGFTNSAIKNTVGADHPKTGNCYGFGFGVVRFDLQGPDCQKAVNRLDSQGGGECYIFSGNADDYWNHNFEESKLQKTDCNQDFIDKYNGKGGNLSSGPASGFCYVVANDKISAKGCSEHEVLVENAKARVERQAEEAAKENGSGSLNLNVTNNDVYPDTCGSGDDAVSIRLNIGCKGQGNAIVDLLLAIVRLLTAGVGIVLVGSIIVAGIQYTTSAGDPNSQAAAIKRIQSTVLALVLFMLTYAIMNWIIPGQVLQPGSGSGGQNTQETTSEEPN